MPRANHWKTLLKARAIENQCYVVGVNRVGTDGNGHYYSGNSSIFDYNGDLIIEERHKETVVTFKLTKSPMMEFRKRLPFLEDQEIYEHAKFVDE